MKKQFEEIKFDDWDIPIKVSKLARKLANKSQCLILEHNKAVHELMQELDKDNPNITFNEAMSDEFSFFTGENFV